MKTASEVLEYFCKSGHSTPILSADFDIFPASLARAGDNSVFFVKCLPKTASLTCLRNCLIVGPYADVDFERPDLLYIASRDPRASFFDMVRNIFFVKDAGFFIHPSALIDPSVKLGEDVRIHANVVIGPECSISDRTEIRSGVHLFRNVQIGCDCLIKSNSVIGQEGFGIYQGQDGINVMIPHVGGVRIGDRVVIGALNTVCSGTLDATVIGNDTKIDDHVHIAHNCIIGSNAVITACAELSGSVTLEDNVWIGPQACIMNKKTIHVNAMAGLGAVITKDVPADSVVVGNPARILRRRS